MEQAIRYAEGLLLKGVSGRLQKTNCDAAMPASFVLTDFQAAVKNSAD
jgi:hypothetical protein